MDQAKCVILFVDYVTCKDGIALDRCTLSDVFLSDLYGVAQKGLVR